MDGAPSGNDQSIEVALLGFLLAHHVECDDGKQDAR
jgi:hypothetical protein